jgi:hemolysin activation/secretion protein
MRPTSKLFAAVIFSLLSSSALAQNVPGSVDPGRVINELKKALDDVPASKQAAPTDMTRTADVEAPAGADKITLILKDINVVGANVLPSDKLRSVYADKIGKKITLTEVYAIANAITRLYRDNGYILSRAVVPQQEIGNGVVKIQIVEGFISGYSIQGQTAGADEQIAAYAKQLMSSGTLSAKNLERYLLLMNDLPGVTVRAVLSPSKTTVGGANLTLVTEQKRLEGFGAVDNFGSHYLGEERLTGGLQFNSLFGMTDKVSLSGLWAPDHDELKFFNAGYEQNIGDNGTTLGLSSSYTMTSPTLPDDLGGTLGTNGRAYVISATAQHPFIRSRSTNLTGRVQFDASQNKTLYYPGLESIETRDDQRIFRLGGVMSFLDGLAGYNTIDSSLSRGFEFMGASQKGDDKLSRSNGDPSFTKFNLEATRLQRLIGPFTGLLGVTGQYSVDPLLASEEFGMGGSSYGRGYDSSEVTGDSGVAAKVEIAFNNSIEKPYLNDYQIYTFYDVGAAWNRDEAATVDERQSTASVGIGTRLNFNDTVRGDAYLAKPMTRPVSSRGEHGDDVRLKFLLSTNF